MKHFPELIARLPVYEGRFDAVQLAAEGCTVLFASYPAGTETLLRGIAAGRRCYGESRAEDAPAGN